MIEAKENRRQKNKRKTREKIIIKAIQLFSENGLGSVSMQVIAEKADIGKGTIYNYFKNKDILLAECVEKILNEIIASVQSSLLLKGKSSLEESINSLFAAYIDFFKANLPYLKVFSQFKGRLLLDTEHAETLKAVNQDYLRKLAILLESILKEHKVDKGVLQTVPVYLSGIISGYLSDSIGYLLENKDYDYNEIVKQIFLKGVFSFREKETTEEKAKP
jgi:AcrR family transcriptional regulator